MMHGDAIYAPETSKVWNILFSYNKLTVLILEGMDGQWKKSSIMQLLNGWR